MPDLRVVESELSAIWRCVTKNKTSNVGLVYYNFLNDIYTFNHIAFFVQTHKIIDQVVNGDDVEQPQDNLAGMSVMVDKVVDIVDHLFKSTVKEGLVEGVTEIPHAQI